MTNVPMGVCYFEKNGIFASNCKISSFGLLIPGRPIFGIGLNVTRKAKKIRVFGVKVVNCGTINALSKGESGNRLAGGGLLEKEFEFKPSFNEYLKDMESVRSNRDKKQGYKLKKQKPNNNLVETIPLEGVEENLNFGAFERSLDKKKVLKVVEQDGLSKNADGIMVKEARVRGKFNYKGKGIKEFKDGFDGKDRYLNTKFRKKLREEMRGEILSKNQFSSIEPELEDSKLTNNLVETIPLEGVEENLKLEVFERSLDKKKVLNVVEQDGFSKNADGIMVKEARVRGKFNYKGKGIKEFKDGFDGKDKYLNTKFRKKLGEETRREILSKNQFSSIEPELEDSNLGKGTKAQNVQESTMVLAPVQRKGRNMDITREPVHDASSLDMLEKKGTDGSQRDFRSIWKTFNGQKISFTGDEKVRRFERNYVQDEIVTADKFTHTSGKLTKSSKAFSERDDDNGLEVDRAAFKNFDEFNDVLDKPRVSRMEMEERIQKLAKRLNGANIDMPEWVFSKSMRSAKIRFSDHSILRVIQILGKLGNWRRVLQVIEWLQMRERFQSHKLRFIYTTALDVLGKANRPVEALNVFHAMQQQMSSYPDLVTYHCVAVTLGQAGHLKELFDVIDIMRSPPKKKFKTGALGKWDPRLEPDIVVYNAVLNACVRRKQWEGAFWVLQQLEQQGQQPSTTTYGLVMEVMYTCGKYNLVHEFFRKVKKSSIPNALTYKVYMNTLWKEGKTDEAVLAVQDMERRGIVGSAALYYDLARCLCSAGRCQEALKQIEKICKVANKPLVVTYTGLIQACLDSGNIHNGAYIFSQMEDYCSPNLVTCNIMLKAYLENGMFEEARELFHKMSEDGNHISSKSDYRVQVMPDIYTFNTMLDACIAEKRWDDFENIYRRMLHHGHHFNAKRHLRMIMDASRAGKEEALETTWNHLARANRIPPPPLIKERFCLKLEKDDYTAALSCITSHPMSDLQAFSRIVWLNLLKENAQRFQKHTLFRLIDDVSILINRSLPNPILQNLISACREFCRNQMTLAEIKQIETVCSFQAELPLKS